jgi:hypothetical protein
VGIDAAWRDRFAIGRGGGARPFHMNVVRILEVERRVGRARGDGLRRGVGGVADEGGRAFVKGPGGSMIELTPFASGRDESACRWARRHLLLSVASCLDGSEGPRAFAPPRQIASGSVAALGPLVWLLPLSSVPFLLSQLGLLPPLPRPPHLFLQPLLSATLPLSFLLFQPQSLLFPHFPRLLFLLPPSGLFLALSGESGGMVDCIGCPSQRAVLRC